MSLANLQLRTDKITYGDADITLYGLSANDIAGIVLGHMPSLEQVFNIIESAGVKQASDLANVNVAQVGQRMLAEAPGFIAAAIAYAAHEPDQSEKVQMLPAPVQLDALKKVAQLTFVDEAGFREFVGNVVAALRSAKGVVPQKTEAETGPVSRAVSASLSGGSESAQQSLS